MPTATTPDYSAILSALGSRNWQGFQDAIHAIPGEWERFVSTPGIQGNDSYGNWPTWDRLTPIANQLWPQGGTTPTPTPTPTPGAGGAAGGGGFAGGLVDLGLGAQGSGPSYNITSPFRHLYSQLMIDQFGVKNPSSEYRMGNDGKIQEAKVNWWEPNAQPGPYAPVPVQPQT